MQPSFSSKDSESEERKRLERRQNRFAKESTTEINKSTKSVNKPNDILIGTCEELEKNYLRLTSAPNPSTIRPLAILEQAFPFVLNKYQLNNDWSYISSQLKSIRQDLIVQSIRNDFALLVYEENARLALEMGDRDQFVQCQTQVETLYDSGCNRTHLMEFLSYRLLYSLLLGDCQRVNRTLIDIHEEKLSSRKSNDIDIVLDFCSSFRRKNYTQLFILYKSLPRRACCVVNFFIDIYRKQMIQIFIWGFTPTLPIDIVTTMLAYNSNEIYWLKLELNSTETEGIFHCSSPVELHKQRAKLTVSIERPIVTPPAFQLQTEQVNSTTIRIHVIPNGYIGVNRINCHWDDKKKYAQVVDLIIGEKPGPIQLKKSCEAYDRRYVQCTLLAPIVARATQNKFTPTYEFVEQNTENYYNIKQVTVNITDENELAVNFIPFDKSRIPKKAFMRVNISLKPFGSENYTFEIAPIHLTKVDFRVENISADQVTLMIDHNRIGTISERLCTGHVTLVDNTKQLIGVQVRDIPETSSQMISINRLRPSTNYKICLHCFYERTDESFTKEICRSITTKGNFLLFVSNTSIVGNLEASQFVLWLVGSVFGIGGFILIVILCIVFKKICKKTDIPKVKRSNRSEEVSYSSSSEDDQHEPIARLTDSNRYTNEPRNTVNDSTIYHSPPFAHGDCILENGEIDEIDPFLDPKYQYIEGLLNDITDNNIVNPDTVDLTRSKN
ncbi:unnamed protein product [Rotaria socialis]|uniref:SAC3/GANP/THP3 conserved domain-containing protein n=3 Tax=Rotaria socialis TaxID=392032 RepID=A0A820KMN1_9BILA|nr:unnamed protein product [Rotaria socialis]